MQDGGAVGSRRGDFNSVQFGFFPLGNTRRGCKGTLSSEVMERKRRTAQSLRAQTGLSCLLTFLAGKVCHCPSLSCWSTKSSTPVAGESPLICSATAVSSQQPSKTPYQPASAPEVKTESSSTAHSVSLPLISSESLVAPAIPQITPAGSITPAAPEPKPKSLSLEEYRRLRQQKKPASVEKQDKSVTKWPSLQELPKELLPIPHLPDPNPKELRRANPQAAKKEVEEVKPAWQPRGPCAPPTPDALLQPPAYMISSSSKASAAIPVSRPQQTQDASRLLQRPPTTPPDSANTSATHTHTTAKPAEPCVPQSFAPPASLMPSVQVVSSANRECTLPDSGRKGEAEFINPKSVQDTKVCPKTTTNIHKPTAASGSVPSVNVVSQKMSGVTVSTSRGNPLTSNRKSPKPTAKEQSSQPCAAISLDSRNRTNHPAVIESKERSTTAMRPQRTKSDTQELIESFTSEIVGGIVLRQYQAKSSQRIIFQFCNCDEAAMVPARAVLDSIRPNERSPAAALASKTTPPNQMWKPLVPLILLGKANTSEASKPSASKVIQIEPQPLPSIRFRSKATPAAASVAPDLACMDHDYCFSNKSLSPDEPGKRWNVKTQSVFTIKPLKQHPSSPAPSPQSATNSVISSKTQDCPRTVQAEKKTEDESEEWSVKEMPDASPSQQECVTSPRRGPSGRSYRRYTASRTPSPRCSPKERSRGRSRKRFYCSPSPTSSCSDSYSSRSRPSYRPRYCHGTKTDVEETKRHKEKAIEERRVVYVGKIRGSMTQRELRDRFSLFGEIEECTLHFREHGDNYGFVTYYNTNDAFTAIENGSKLRKPDELPFDLCFGGRRQFCQSSYADLGKHAARVLLFPHVYMGVSVMLCIMFA
ncbi:hypothetical protein GOODEAATRI_004564 [Goodea atripinnis]|uniref:RRM domain-containing protein n=1 Tax=Goodea atripinnis TaxID=208336 RepID=A0ABV0MQG7_9TELE